MIYELGQTFIWFLREIDNNYVALCVQLMVRWVIDEAMSNNCHIPAILNSIETCVHCKTHYTFMDIIGT